MLRDAAIPPRISISVGDVIPQCIHPTRQQQQSGTTRNDELNGRTRPRTSASMTPRCRGLWQLNQRLRRELNGRRNRRDRFADEQVRRERQRTIRAGGRCSVALVPRLQNPCG